MLKHVSRPLLIFAYLSLCLFMKCCILQSFSNMPASFTDMGILYTGFQCLFTMFYIQLESSRIKFVDVLGYEMTSSIPFPHISTWLEQQAFYKQPVSTMNTGSHMVLVIPVFVRSGERQRQEETARTFGRWRLQLLSGSGWDTYKLCMGVPGLKSLQHSTRLEMTRSYMIILDQLFFWASLFFLTP